MLLLKPYEMRAIDDQKKIVWLASYPKSGNTWFRAFLTALLNPSSMEVDINNMHPTTIASNRQLFDEMSGVSSADLTFDEIDHLRPLIYRNSVVKSDEIIYQKVHDAYSVVPHVEALFPADITKLVLYFIRNPLDVAVSFANHLSTSIDRIISIMNNPDYAFCPYKDRLHNQLRQKLSTWSGHVKSWVDDSDLPVQVIRYEDLKNIPIATFSRAVSYIGLDVTLQEIEAALERSSFDRLKKQEEVKGFSEKSAASASFFRKGIVGDWRNVLTPEQINRIFETQGNTMKRFGYTGDE